MLLAANQLGPHSTSCRWPSPSRHCLACRAQYDYDQLPEAKRTLTKALHLAPTDHQLRFDVALTLQVGWLGTGAGGGGWWWLTVAH